MRIRGCIKQLLQICQPYSRRREMRLKVFVSDRGPCHPSSSLFNQTALLLVPVRYCSCELRAHVPGIVPRNKSGDSAVDQPEMLHGCIKLDLRQRPLEGQLNLPGVPSSLEH